LSSSAAEVSAARLTQFSCYDFAEHVDPLNVLSAE
jgi:hypothetical protein